MVAVAVTGAALFLGAFLVLRSVSNDIKARVERQVSVVAQDVARQVASGLAPRGFVFNAAVGEGFVPPSVTVTDLETGRVVIIIEPGLAVEDPATSGPQTQKFAIGLDQAGAPGVERATGPAIKRTVDVEVGFGRYRVEASSPLSIVSKNTSALRNSLAAGFPALAVLVGFVTWILAGRSLRPVERMRAQVEEISAQTLDRRVPVPDTEDEIGRLAHTMNGMLDRLESSSTRQREFVSDASHELRSPIAAIRSQLEVALHDPAHTDWLAVATGTLAENERLERLVDDLLTLARLDEGRVPAVEDVDLEDVVREESARLRDARLRQDVIHVRVRANREQIGRALRNLLENATRFARDRIDLNLSSEDGRALLSVTDDGPGIPEADRQRVFDRFTRLDEGRARSHGGVGLGLALVRGIVAAHGGSIEARAAEGGGARLVMSLPSGAER
jgi:signal transduction histidine kinase